MPHINRIRVNNVKYNFGTQFYDDFMMRFSGKNTIYDLANGGGKSVLMLLLFQNLIPNCTLDDKQPIEKLFRTGEGSKTIHSLIEWNLSDIHVKDNYKYMLTGFCARKAKDSEQENKDNATIEYFNYCIFYREYNDNDIKNLPLSNGSERITYNGLKNYLRELERKDFSLSIKIFERKSDYQRFISDYGLYESEWEIIRGINKTEGHVRTYFETNYRTTRKVVEDLLIEEIIQKSFVSKYGAVEEDTMAQTLLDIKDKLIELSQKKSRISDYDRQQEIIEAFIGRTAMVKNMYFDKDNLEGQVCRLYNTVSGKEEKYNEDKQALITKLEEIRESVKELSRLCDTAKIMLEKKVIDEMNEKLSIVSQEAEQLKAELENKKAGLRFKESGNDYLDYLEYKKEADTITEIISARRQDGSAILQEAEELAYELNKRNSVKLAELDKILEKEKQISENESKTNFSLEEKKKELENKKAILKYRLDAAERECVIISEKIARAMNDVGIIVTSSLKTDIGKLQMQIDDKERKQKDFELLLKELQEREKTSKIIREKKKYELDVLEEKEKDLEKIEAKTKSDNERYSKIKDVYSDKKIEQMLMDIIKQISEKESLLANAEKELKLLKSGETVMQTKDVENICDYIWRYHGDICITGAKYLSDKSEDMREELLERIPMLPYSIVITGRFKEVVEDIKITEMSTSDFVCIIDEEAIIRNKEIINGENVIISTGKKDTFISDKAIASRISQCEEQLEELAISIKRLYEYEKVIRDDYVFLCNYTKTDKDMKLSDCRNEILTLENEIEKLDLECKECESDIKRTLENISANQNDINDISASRENLKKLYDMQEEYEKLENSLSLIKKEDFAINKEYKDIEARLEASLNQAMVRKNKISNILAEKEKIEKEWNEKYKTYYKGDFDIEISASYETIVSKLDGLIFVIREESGDLADKEKLLRNYEESMKKALNSIRYRETDVEEVKEAFNANELSRTSDEELRSIKSECSKVNKELENTFKEIDDIRSKRDKSEGGISHGIKQIEEKYGVFLEDGIPSDGIKEFVETNTQTKMTFTDKEKLLNTELKELEDFAGKQVIVKENLERIINGGQIQLGKYQGVMDENINLYEKSKELSKEYDKFVKLLYEKKDEFEKNKKMLIETLINLNASELAVEIDRNIIFPNSTEETDVLVNGLKDTNLCIELEKSRISKGIEDMERIKDNFENQCIQSCIKIKTELERLPKLSGINMEGENISMIDLRIPYVNEDLYKERMEGYIDEIVNEADDIRSQEEKLKYIRTRLSWKKMFAVIVNDMNAIRLKLYKRERIVENSRYLPYEEAVGSTGQSQGIYIQFLVSIINYISSVNSKGADSMKLKKVIFIDNPFGAAKDVYIWEPIFKLLKTNNVQLIVPARGATPAITGRFDVNYVLGQKMMNGKQQTVVVDYYSNVDNSNMEYTTLSYEQTSMF